MHKNHTRHTFTHRSIHLLVFSPIKTHKNRKRGGMKLTLSCSFGFEEDWKEFDVVFGPNKPSFDDFELRGFLRE